MQKCLHFCIVEPSGEGLRSSSLASRVKRSPSILKRPFPRLSILHYEIVPQLGLPGSGLKGGDGRGAAFF